MTETKDRRPLLTGPATETTTKSKRSGWVTLEHPLGPIEWKCWCGAHDIVPDNNDGHDWDSVNRHRARHGAKAVGR